MHAAALRLSLLPLIALTCPAAAQQSGSDTINVIGRKPEEARKEAQDFVRKMGVTERPVARWVEPICPHVFGVAPEIGKRVTDRIHVVARDVKIAVAKEPCRANVILSFASDGAALVREIARKAPGKLAEVSAEDRPALLTGDAPIRWWHATDTRTKDGMAGTGNEQPPFAQLDGPGGVPMAGDVHFQYRSSIVSTQMVRVLKGATIIIDANRAAGTSLDSVAAFASLIALAEVQPNDEAPAQSILSLFKTGGPTDLTSIDRSFLRALYRLPLDRTALAQRGLLVKGLLASAGQSDE
ncbi:hypothetical protein ACFSCW_07435 [Sphingomonas tabacisoli]|uniref:Uncharacterized protein n=1 Tax=Sphingomonas tabacisoli TaxID=2249466 RepID=A0ABW4I2H9_9SPHN